MTLFCHCICYCLVLLLLPYYFCFLIVFLFYNKFFFSIDLAVCSAVGLKHCMGSLHPSITDRDKYCSFCSIQFHIQFSTICVKIKHVQIKRLFWVTARRFTFTGKFHWSRLFWMYLSCVYACICVYLCVCACVHLFSEIKIQYGNN